MALSRDVDMEHGDVWRRKPPHIPFACMDVMLPGLAQLRAQYRQLRGVTLPNSLPPAIQFDPRAFIEGSASFNGTAHTANTGPINSATVLGSDLAFAGVAQLAQLIQSRQVSALELTELYLERLQRFDPQLQCVVTLTAELALAEARRADVEIAAGQIRSPLHGIPWGAKDLLDTRGLRTTWGARPFKDRVPDQGAAVVERLRAAGAVLAAKLSLGELAWGDVWFGGQTRNPWNIQRTDRFAAHLPANGTLGEALPPQTPPPGWLN